uniref:Cell division cycle protein 123 homolog n=1 Tax=Arcella intermedia TaxID=1963864 RepID=A0A6B2LAG5_9EUKA
MHAPRAVVIRLPWDFVRYLEEDGIILSKDDKSLPDYQNISDEDDDDPQNDTPQLNFDELKKEITDGIKTLGGKVFPKLNWSAPQDASWMIPDGSLGCINADQVVLLLKSSDAISTDIEQYSHLSGHQENPSPFTLVLKEYMNIHQSYEFRCFVAAKELIAISQRYPTKFYPFLVKEKENLLQTLKSFFLENIRHGMNETEYVVDVYVVPKEKRVYIIDFGIFGPMSDPALFSWEELLPSSKDRSTQNCIMRVVENEMGIQPNEALVSRVPYDLKDFSDDGALKEYFNNLNYEQMKEENNKK